MSGDLWRNDDDPFSAEADPCPPRVVPNGSHASEKVASTGARQGNDGVACVCRNPGRRHLLAGAMGLPALLLVGPLPASALPLRVPCVQTQQKPEPCRHRFCRYYGGTDDIHGRA